MTIFYLNYVRAPNEIYAYEFTADQRREVLRVVGRQAVNPELSLDWRDVLYIETRIRELCGRDRRLTC